ncbi:MAG: UDP-N-acetylmuramoyl-L-alanyl-D-glutamate--2,6-diaminopimelate ligase [Actinobacteria bacterium]|nr:UDP-N-acetylmuramoyl-L-alanyl-D-glutamate--2,6-diaminopimelate ligase [Actinomycetota bacterium]
MSLRSVAECAGVPATAGGVVDPRVVVTGVTLDSRAVRPGDLYAALPGAHLHGADFVAGAIALGAVAILTDQHGAARLALNEIPVPVLVVPDPRAILGGVAARVYGRASEELTMLGITGTNGKTTTAYLVDSALRALGRVTGLIGTVETRIGQDRIKSVRTTPESADLHALFAVMLERGVDTCTMEVSSHALTLHRVDGVRYDVVAFTNLSQDHLDFHGSMESYYLSKASMFTPERAVRGVVCVDDEWGRRLVRESGVPVVSVSSRQYVMADWQIHPAGPGGSAFELVGEGQRLSLRSALPGDFNQVNTAVAALVLMAAGYAGQAVGLALAADPHVPGRMERVLAHDVGSVETVASVEIPVQSRMPLAVVDFAHTPDAVAAALKALRHNTSGSLIAVLGAGGDRDSGKREAIGAAAAAYADFVVVTDDNPRSEDPADIRAAVMRGALAHDRSALRPPGRIVEIGGRGQAIRAAVARSGVGDTVVVLGKGHESGQEIAGVVHPFEDRAELRAALIEHAASMEPPPSGEYRGGHSATEANRGEAG